MPLKNNKFVLEKSRYDTTDCYIHPCSELWVISAIDIFITFFVLTLFLHTFLSLMLKNKSVVLLHSNFLQSALRPIKFQLLYLCFHSLVPWKRRKQLKSVQCWLFVFISFWLPRFGINTLCFGQVYDFRYNDIPLQYDDKIYKELINGGIDNLLAQHVAHMFTRDPLQVNKFA